MDTFSCNSFEQKYDHDDDDVDDHQEESGWTTYLDDFSNQYCTTHHDESDHQGKSFSSLPNGSPSLVFSDTATDAFSGPTLPVNCPVILKSGRGRAKKICEDDSLEDTASSPVNSPKVSHFEHIQTLPRKTDYVSSSFVMGNMRSIGDHQIQIQEGDEPKMNMMRNLREGNNNINSNMDLRSRGLCVVPMSSLANFNDRF